MRNPVLFVLMLAVAGCSDPTASSASGREAPGDQPAVEMPATGQATTDQPNPPTTADDVAAASVESAAANQSNAKLALDGGGLRIFTVATGSSRLIPFGAGKAETLDMLGAVQGAPPSDQGENIDCGATNAAWPDGLTVWFARGKFVGWSLASADAPLSTAGGLKVGSTRTELENGATVATIAASSLGEEFTAGDVGGLLDSAAADARVTHLWAGAVCIAR